MSRQSCVRKRRAASIERPSLLEARLLTASDPIAVSHALAVLYCALSDIILQ